ncbi:MAG TPA: hypothetical protein VNO21_13015, partial [Polyangiaceae bacterium]|nr:hypothetical protein [Polyangiaceae bacterium]
GQPASVQETDYTYRDPTWSGQQREFRGFRDVSTRTAGDANSPTSTTRTNFLTGDCADETSDGVDDCSLAQRWRDNAREALKGLSVASETFDDNGVYLATSHTTYTLRHLYTGLDGRAIRQAFPNGSDSWMYDTPAFVPSSTSLTVNDVVLDGGTGGVIPASSLTLRSASGRAHVQTARNLDSFGNVTAETELGCVDGCAQVDEPITKRAEFDIVPGDTSHWLYRPTHSWVEGSQTAKRHEQLIDYDDRGRATLTREQLAGTLPLDRFHEAPSKNVAPSPPEASADGTILVSTQQYDAFGNITYRTAPNHRCRKVTFETDFAQLPIAETIYVGAATGDCGATALTAYAAYDRGLAAPVNFIDLHGELSTMTYDGFGRRASMRKPNPAQIGAASPVDSVRIEYILPTDPVATPYSLFHTQTQDGPTDADATYHDEWTFLDGAGRKVITLEEADANAGDGGQWVVSGQADYDAKGGVRRAYQPWFWTGDPKAFPLGAAPSAAFTLSQNDAFGRAVRSYALDGTQVLRTDHHALSTDVWDAEDLGTGPHAGTYSSERKDGHGRTIAAVERVHGAGSGIEAREIQNTYLATGELIAIRRVRGSDTVARSMQYDSIGRMVLNIEPDASKTTSTGQLRAWRYAYNDNGDLVGTSDARGCGVNYHYDAGGRILAEDYSPCLAIHADYSAPNLGTGDGTEVYYHYDTLDSSAPATIDDCTINSNLSMGRLVSIADRGSKTLTSSDGRGRAACVARQVVKPGPPSDSLENRYAPRWYTVATSYDGADRSTQASTGAKVAELLGADGASVVTTAYTARGAVQTVGGSYGTLVSGVTHDADGLALQIGYGDAAATKTGFKYDARRRVSSVQTYRGAPQLWSQAPSAYTPAPDPQGPPTSFQLLLEDTDYTYDQVDNPTKIQDYRVVSEWPDGAKPVTRTMQYDDLYRITRMDYTYDGGSDPWISPFALEDGGGHDPRRAAPTPHLSFSKRVLSQTFQYDWLGNTTSTADDSGGFYERSLGTITNGTPTAGPYQLQSATGGTAPRDGSLDARYDDAGNLVGLSVARNASAPCLPT